MLGSSPVLFAALLICVINAQNCGVINDNQQRIQMQGPPGKRAEIDYGKMKKIVVEAVKTEMAAEIEHGQIMGVVDKAVKAGMALITTEVGKMQTEMLKLRSEMDEIKVSAKNIQKSEIPTILEDIVNDIMSGNDRNRSLQHLPKVFVAIPRTPDEVKDLAEKYEAEKKYTHSVILYYTAGMMDKSTGNAGVSYKRFRVQDIRNVGTKMRDANQDFIVTKFWVIPLMEELLEQLRQIPEASHEYKVEKQSWCLRDIGRFFFYLGDYENQFNNNKLCADTMRQLGQKANNYRIYAYCLHNSGAGLKNLGKYSEAVPYFEEAIDTYKSAISDFPSELSRQKDLALANEQLKDAKSKLRL